MCEEGLSVSPLSGVGFGLTELGAEILVFYSTFTPGPWCVCLVAFWTSKPCKHDLCDFATLPRSASSLDVSICSLMAFRSGIEP